MLSTVLYIDLWETTNLEKHRHETRTLDCVLPHPRSKMYRAVTALASSTLSLDQAPGLLLRLLKECSRHLTRRKRRLESSHSLYKHGLAVRTSSDYQAEWSPIETQT